MAIREPYDGGVGTERRLVWGAEYPDLLLTETVAFHDRRVKDTAYDNGDRKSASPNRRPRRVMTIWISTVFRRDRCSWNSIAHAIRPRITHGSHANYTTKTDYWT